MLVESVFGGALISCARNTSISAGSQAGAENEAVEDEEEEEARCRK